MTVFDGLSLNNSPADREGGPAFLSVVYSYVTLPYIHFSCPFSVSRTFVFLHFQLLEDQKGDSLSKESPCRNGSFRLTDVCLQALQELLSV